LEANRNFRLLDVLLWLTLPMWLARAKAKAKPASKQGLASRLLGRLAGKKTGAASNKKAVLQSKTKKPAPTKKTSKPKPSPPSKAAATPKSKPDTRAPLPPPAEPRRLVPPPTLPVPDAHAPVAAPSLFFPRSGQAVETLTPSLRWLYVGGATRYEVEWSRDSHFGRAQTSSAFSSQTVVDLDSAHALEPGSVYVWRVRGGNEAGWGPWSHAESFRTPDKR
jgi:hypothetical protein